MEQDRPRSFNLRMPDCVLTLRGYVSRLRQCRESAFRITSLLLDNMKPACFYHFMRLLSILCRGTACYHEGISAQGRQHVLGNQIIQGVAVIYNVQKCHSCESGGRW